MQLIDKVDPIEVTTVALPDKLGKYLHIHAVGHVGETGWVMPRLLRRFSRGRAEKTLELSFAADPPYGLVGEIELPIVAGFFIEFEDWMMKVRIYDSKGCQAIRISMYDAYLVRGAYCLENPGHGQCFPFHGCYLAVFLNLESAIFDFQFPEPLIPTLLDCHERRAR